MQATAGDWRLGKAWAAALWAAWVCAAPAFGAPAPTEPAIAAAAEPVYPPALLDRGVGGAVVVEFTVRADGSTADVLVVDSAGPEFDAAATDAARRLRFVAATRGGKPVAARIRYRFVFDPTQVAQRRTAARSEGRFDRRDVERHPAGFSSLRGTLHEKGTGRPLAGAVLVVDGGTADAVVDRQGDFAFGVIAPGPHTVQLAEGEHKALAVAVVVTAGRTARITLRAERLRYGLYRATAEGPPRAGENVRRALDAEEIQRVPGVYGDAMKVVQNLPGVARPSPFGGEVTADPPFVQVHGIT